MKKDDIDTGDLDHSATFRQSVRERDADGQIVQSWRDVMTVWAAVGYLRGGEGVVQARMAARSPAIVTIRNSQAARQIGHDWRVVARDRTGIERLYEVKELPRPSKSGAYLEMLVEVQG